MVFAIKKTLHAIEQNREDVKAKRGAWKKSQRERVIDYVLNVRFERTSILSSIRANGDMVPLVFEGALNGELFKAYVRILVSRRSYTELPLYSCPFY